MNENSLTDRVYVREKEQLKTNIENDFLPLIFYPVLDLINLDKKVFVMDNHLEKLFDEPVIVKTSVSQLPSSLALEEIKSKKMEFIEKLKSESSLLPQIRLNQNSSDLVKIFSDIREHNELFKHHGKKVYVSSFRILFSHDSLNQAEGEQYQSEIDEDSGSEDKNSISTPWL